LTHTFVIPAYKESPYLENCIQSLLSQSVKSRIVLTTSTPSAYLQQIAEKYSLDYFSHRPKGIAEDWNFALSKAGASLTTIAHQDDIYEPSYTENILNSVTGDTLIAFTGYYDLVQDQKRERSLNYFVKKALLFPFLFNRRLDGAFAKKLILKFGDPICCPSVTFNLEALKNFRFSEKFTCTLDWYAWYQLAEQKGAFCYIDKNLMGHRIHEESETTASLSAGIRKKEEEEMFRMLWGKNTAAFISWIYSLGHADNQIKKRFI
jgi:glycosyltransferase involved in cell wall biosynthesis